MWSTVVATSKCPDNPDIEARAVFAIKNSLGAVTVAVIFDPSDDELPIRIISGGEMFARAKSGHWEEKKLPWLAWEDYDALREVLTVIGYCRANTKDWVGVIHASRKQLRAEEMIHSTACIRTEALLDGHV